MCTGWLIGKDTVATAGHCVHEGGGGTITVELDIVPDEYEPHAVLSTKLVAFVLFPQLAAMAGGLAAAKLRGGQWAKESALCLSQVAG